MNGKWFWWGGADKEEFLALWRHMFDYFTTTKGLNNLLWLYSSNSEDAWTRSVDFYYPGDAYCDVVGLDNYTDDLKWGGAV